MTGTRESAPGYSFTVSGAAYFEALDHNGTSAARWGVPRPSRVERLSRGYRAVFEGVSREEADAILARLQEAGDAAWISTLRGERGNSMYTAAEIRAAKACAAAAERLAALLA